MGGVNAQAALKYAFETFLGVEATHNRSIRGSCCDVHVVDIVMDHYPNADVRCWRFLHSSFRQDGSYGWTEELEHASVSS